ncbi:ralBP1-associated Eps domain-containing protein 1-like isoform X2 [Gigantopelta aegis]|uniref:ralBP1-associated Eps domain-containing protein 1-like isoform X2 n=1 Tax=Gigantopelta aegis TaxID=1735272 RepID=UPI001B88C13B|nr:ralBP1-associated Eps domain-containing protein 1-like isoform X2 [Gigantopelta aegis]
MEGLKLSEQEQQFYGELFQTCDVDGNGKITGIKASELFRASGLSQEQLVQITELCGAKRLGHFGRSQFYIALKLIAATQIGLPVKLDSLNSGVDIPLPKFGKISDQGDRRLHLGTDTEIMSMSDSKPIPPQTGQLPPPPSGKKSHTRSLSGQYRGMVLDGQSSFTQQPQTINRDEADDSKSPPYSPTKTPPSSPPARRQLLKQQTAPASFPAVAVMAAVNTQQPVVVDGGHVNPVALSSGAYVNSATENGNWAMFEEEDAHLLLGTGIKKWTDSLEPPGFDSSSISSEAESVDDIWSITEEQREYYEKQFKTMQPELTGIITGPVAKEFFEKSKLPVLELSKIWQLSDLNRDGALSIDEFCIAMHLVVLRRNDIELPEQLPISLMPYSTLSNDEPFAADLPPGSTLKRATPPSPQATQWTASFIQESPGSSGVPSPTIRPVNFEFAKPNASDPDSNIIHPVALRMSPEGLPLPSDGYDRSRALSDPVGHDPISPDDESLSPSKQRSLTESLVDSDQSSKYNAPLHGRPRPIPKKHANTVPMVGQGKIQPPPSQDLPAGPERPNVLLSAISCDNQGPPAPPPRPPGAHGRSMSVDYKTKLEGGTSTLLPPPAVPPRVSPKDPPARKLTDMKGTGAIDVSEKSVSFVDIKQNDSTMSNQLTNDSASASGDFSADSFVSCTSVEKKDVWTAGDEQDSSPGKLSESFLRQVSRDKRELTMAVRTHKERNVMLTRLNSELNQELQEVMEQRIALEIQLEHLRPFSS